MLSGSAAAYVVSTNDFSSDMSDNMADETAEDISVNYNLKLEAIAESKEGVNGGGSSRSSNSISDAVDILSSANSNTGTAPERGAADPSDPGWVWDETSPVLSNLMVNFANYDAGSGKAGDFIFDPALEKVFGDFGRVVSGPSGPKVLAQMDFFITLDTQIYAPIGGEVVRFVYQSSTNDYSIHIRPVFNSVWLINFDHLRNVPASITEGSIITAEQYIGTPGSWFSNGMVELMITYDKGEGATGYCPYDFLSSSLKATYTAKINTLMSEWETFKGDPSIYNEAGHVSP